MTTDSFIFHTPGAGPGPRWSCSTVDDEGKLVALLRHGRWTGILAMADRTAGIERFGEPGWELLGERYVLTWPCTLCGCRIQIPARHTERSCLFLLESKFAIARANSYGPF